MLSIRAPLGEKLACERQVAAVERRCNEEIRAARPVMARLSVELTDDVRRLPMFRGKLPSPDKVKVSAPIASCLFSARLVALRKHAACSDVASPAHST